MGLSPLHQTSNVSFEKDPKTQTSRDRGTWKQQEVSAWTKYLLTWSLFSPKQMPVSLCSESNDKVTNLLKFTGLLKVQARGCTPCQETRIGLWWSWNPMCYYRWHKCSSPLPNRLQFHELFQWFAEISMRISDFDRVQDARFNFKPTVQPRSTWTEWPLSSDIQVWLFDPLLVLVLQNQDSFQSPVVISARSKTTVWFQWDAKFIFHSQRRSSAAGRRAGL